MDRGRRAVACVLAVWVLGLVGSGRAWSADDEVAETERDDASSAWRFTVAPYLWLPGVFGTIKAGGATARVDVDIRDSLDLVGDGLSLLAAFGHLEAQRGPFLAFVDTSLIRLDTDQGARLKGLEQGGLSTTPIDVDASVRLDGAIVEFAVGYRALERALGDRPRPLSVELLAGGRYYYFWSQTKVKASAKLLGLPQGPQILRGAARKTETLDWVDPFIGIRWSVPLLANLDLRFRGDIGGFEAGSELAWSLAGFFQYHLDWHPCSSDTWIALGYKALDFDYEADGGELALNMRGPALAVGVTF
jgi:hypothetical protein